MAGRSLWNPGATQALEAADSLAREGTTNSDWISILLARLHLQQGQPERALTALHRRQRAQGSPPFEGALEALRLEGLLAAKLGKKDEAIRAYKSYLWWRTDPEPSKVPQRDSVRAELAALTP